jgi:hypothetical protein
MKNLNTTVDRTGLLIGRRRKRVTTLRPHITPPSGKTLQFIVDVLQHFCLLLRLVQCSRIASFSSARYAQAQLPSCLGRESTRHKVSLRSSHVLIASIERSILISANSTIAVVGQQFRGSASQQPCSLAITRGCYWTIRLFVELIHNTSGVWFRASEERGPWLLIVRGAQQHHINCSFRP